MGDAGDLFATTRTTVESVLGRLGLDVTTIRLRDEADVRAWGLKRGSAQVLLTVSKSDRGVFLRIAAPVVAISASTAGDVKLALFTRLLDLNAKAMRNAAFGVMNDMVIIASERPAEGLDEGEAEQMLRHVGQLADHYDDLFASEYQLTHGSGGVARSATS